MSKYRLQLQHRYTDDENELVAECNRIRSAMAVYGLSVIGYDPGVLVNDMHDGRLPAFDIPAWFMRRMVEQVEKSHT